MTEHENPCSCPRRRHVLVQCKGIWIACFILFLAVSCSKKDPVVARFGNQTIGLHEFRTAYLEMLKKPAAFDSDSLRKNFLSALVQKKVLAEEARKRGMEDERLKNRIDAFRDRQMRDAHFQTVIRPRIQVAEPDIEEAYQFTQEQRHLRHLFAGTQPQADSLYAFLQRGIPFEEIASVVFKDTTLAKNGGDLGWVNWEDMGYDLGMAAFRMPLNEFSKPVQSEYGYHILQVIDEKKNSLITRQQYELSRDKAKSLLENKIGDKLAGEYVQDLMKRTSIQVRLAALKAVGDRLERQFKRKPSPRDMMKPIQLNESEINSVQSSFWDLRNEVLADIDGKPFTVGAFVGALAFVPYDALYQSYKAVLDYAFRDFVITREAKSLHLDRNEDVRIKTRIYEDDLLQLKLRRELIRNVTVDEDEIRAEYERKKTAEFHGLPYDSVRTILRDQLLRDKRIRRIPDKARNLLRGKKVEYFPECIRFDDLDRGTNQR